MANMSELCWVLAGVFCGAFLFFLLIMMLCDTPRRRHPGPSRGAAMREGRWEHQVNGAPRLQREVDGTHRRGDTRTITSFDDASKEWSRSFSGASSPTSMQNSRHGSSSTSRRIQPDEQGAGPSYSTQPTWHGIDSQESLANLAAVGPADYTSQAKSTRRPSALWPDFGMAAAPSLEPLDLGAPATELGSQNFLLEFAMKKSRVLNASEALKGRVLRDGQPARISSGTRFLVRGMSTDNLLGMKMPSRSGNDLKSKDKRRQHPSAREHFVPISEASHRLSSTCPARVHEITVGSSSAAPPRWSSYSESHFPRQYAARHSDREGRLFS